MCSAPERPRRSLEALAEALTHAPHTTDAWKVPLMADAERRLVTTTLNDTVCETPPMNAHELFEWQAAATPDAVALRRALDNVYANCETGSTTKILSAWGFNLME